MITIIDSITSRIESKKANAFYLNSKVEKADLLIQGFRYQGAVCAVYLKKGGKDFFKECTGNFNQLQSGAKSEFTLIASKRKEDCGTDFVLFDDSGEIIFSSDEDIIEAVHGFVYIGCCDKHGLPYTILLAVNISSTGMNTSDLVIDGERSFCDALTKLAIFAFKGGSVHE